MEKGIVYTQDPGSADYPKGYWKGAVTVTKVRNAAKKAGLEVVNARNDSVNRVRTGCSGFLKSPDGKHVYFSQDCSGFSGGRFLYRTAKHDRLANEEMGKKDDYLGSRIRRGLFRSSTGKVLNADVNGAIGILRKKNVFSDADLVSLRDRGDVVSPTVLKYKP